MSISTTLSNKSTTNEITRLSANDETEKLISLKINIQERYN